MSTVVDAFTSLIDLLRIEPILRGIWRAGGVILLLGVLGILLELRMGAKPSRYRSRWFLHDVIYAIFYRGGFWAVFVMAAVLGALETNLAFLQLDVLSDVPKIPAIIVFWIGGDFFVYWCHRLQHSVPFLWAFHRVHHAEEELSALSIHRRHPVDEALFVFSWFIPMVLVLGIRVGHWVPLFVAMNLIEALQHAQLPWRFGPFYKVLVSPVFHAVHHSVDPKHYNANYSIHFSIWDYLFGTAAEVQERPAAYGTDPPMPENLLVQLFTPLRDALQARGRQEVVNGNRSASLDGPPAGEKIIRQS